MEPAADSNNPSSQEERTFAELKKKWGVYNHAELKTRCEEIGSGSDRVENLIREKSLNMLVGDSGLGKSPLLYQLGICVAGDVPFLGHQVKQGRVLYLDFENSPADSVEITSSLSKFLGLPGDTAPDDFLFWNFNDCVPDFGGGNKSPLNLIRDFRPKLAIIDSLSSCFPGVDEKNETANKCLKAFRQVIRETGASIIPLHHLKKPGDSPLSLQDSNLREWFLQARGARSLINGTDARLGVDFPNNPLILDNSQDGKEEICLVMRGFVRVRGEIPTTFLTRVFDENGLPQGYRRASGATLLFNEYQIDKFVKLPDEYTFKKAQQIYGKGAQATTDFLKKCISIGIIKHDGRFYRKLKLAE